jgi:hypothetical protein
LAIISSRLIAYLDTNMFYFKDCKYGTHPWHFGVDPDPAIIVVDLQDASKDEKSKRVKKL